MNQCPTEFRLRRVVGVDHMDTVHLNNKAYRAMKTVLYCFRQFIQMLNASFCRCVWEISDPCFRVDCKRTSFHFSEKLLSLFLHVKIESGITVTVLRLYNIVDSLIFQKLLHQHIRSEAVYINPFQSRLIY